MTGNRRSSRRRGGSGLPRPVFLLILFALPLVGLFWFSGFMRGPVASSDWLKKPRGDEHEAMVERSFLKAQKTLAESDSINIVLDAREKTLSIVLKGVQLRQCNLISVQIDRSIRRLVSARTEDVWLDRPFTLEERRGDIPDPWEPMMEGPVDTLKGASLAKELPMDGELVFDRRLVLHVATPMSSADSLARRGISGWFRGAGERFDSGMDELKEVVTGPATFDLYIRLNREDAAAVLRALPVGGGMALHL